MDVGITTRMKETLKEIYNSPRCTADIHMKTFEALKSRGFVESKGISITQSASFPHERAQLTEVGFNYCKLWFG